MGSFAVSLHVRSDDRDAVNRQVAACSAGEFRVSNPAHGWITVCESRASDQDEDWVEQLNGELSAGLGVACVAFLLHDSDIARYWLHDRGQLLDLYHSVPDYFEPVSSAERKRLRGRPDVLVRYCRPGVTPSQINSVLRADVTFADDTIVQLAQFLGIDPDRSLEDFLHGDDDDSDGGGWGSGDGAPWSGDHEDWNANDDDESATTLKFPRRGLLQEVQQQLTNLFQSVATPTASPQSNALVQAAVAGELSEIRQLVAEGADPNATGAMPVDAVAQSVLPIGSLPGFEVAPLLAAAAKGRTAAVRLLIELGAKAADVHPLFGSALHAAAQAGSAETVQALIEAGLPADIKSLQGQTPLAAIQTIRAQMELTKNMVESMPQLKGMHDQLLSRLSGLSPSQTGWEACEAVLRSAGAR